MNPETLPLRDIHLPSPVGWWPLATGWWIVIALLILLAGAALLHHFRPEARRRRQAMALLSRYYRQWQSHQQTVQLTRNLSSLLRRYAIATGGRAAAAGVTGEDWINYLNQSTDKPVFAGSVARHLTETPYAPVSQALTEAEVLNLLSACRQWVASQ